LRRPNTTSLIGKSLMMILFLGTKRSKFGS
jgi:hypothetical protein